MMMLKHSCIIIICVASFKLCFCVAYGREIVWGKNYVVYFVKSPYSRGDYDSWLCGGTLVTDQKILTSAACLVEMKNIYAIAGYKKYVNADNIDENICTKEKKQKVVKFYTTEDYAISAPDPSVWLWRDVGVALVEKPYDFSDTSFKLICSYVPNTIEINYDKKFEEPGAFVLFFGWGGTVARDPNESNLEDSNGEILQEGSLRIVLNSTCVEKSSESNKYLKTLIYDYKLICAQLNRAEMDADGYDLHVIVKRSHEYLNKTVDRSFKTPEFGGIGGNDTQYNETRRQKASSMPLFCQNDHGGPLIRFIGKKEILLGIALTGFINEKYECRAPLLFTSTSTVGHIIKCMLVMDNAVREECNLNITREGDRVKEVNVVWPKDTTLRAVPDGGEESLEYLRQGDDEFVLQMRPTNDINNNTNNTELLDGLDDQEKEQVIEIQKNDSLENQSPNPLLNLRKQQQGGQQPSQYDQVYDQIYEQPRQNFEVRGDPYGHLQTPPDNNKQMDSYNSPQIDSNNFPQANSYKQPQIDSYNSPQADSYIQPQMDPNIPPQMDSYQQPQTVPHSSPQINSNDAPQMDSYKRPQVDSYYSPQIDSYNVPARDSYNDPQVEAHVQPQMDPYSSPQTDLHVQAQINPYNSPQIDSYNTPQRDSYNNPQVNSNMQPKMDLQSPLGGNLQVDSSYKGHQVNPYNTPQENTYFGPPRDSYKEAQIDSYKDTIFYKMPQMGSYKQPQDVSYKAEQMDSNKSPQVDIYKKPPSETYKGPEIDTYNQAQLDIYMEITTEPQKNYLSPTNNQPQTDQDQMKFLPRDPYSSAQMQSFMQPQLKTEKQAEEDIFSPPNSETQPDGPLGQSLVEAVNILSFQPKIESFRLPIVEPFKPSKIEPYNEQYSYKIFNEKIRSDLVEPFDLSQSRQSESSLGQPNLSPQSASNQDQTQTISALRERPSDPLIGHTSELTQDDHQSFEQMFLSQLNAPPAEKPSTSTPEETFEDLYKSLHDPNDMLRNQNFETPNEQPKPSQQHFEHALEQIDQQFDHVTKLSYDQFHTIPLRDSDPLDAKPQDQNAGGDEVKVRPQMPLDYQNDYVSYNTRRNDSV